MKGKGGLEAGACARPLTGRGGMVPTWSSNVAWNFFNCHGTMGGQRRGQAVNPID